jgi:predicted nucleotidyltransferase
VRRLKPRYAREGFVICGIFGSYARQDFDEHSDIDIAYRLEGERFFARFRGLTAATRVREIGEELARALGKRVDLVSMNPLNPLLREHLARELIDA